MNRRHQPELKAEIVRSGTWRFQGRHVSEVWIVRQNFACDGDTLNRRGEVYYVCPAPRRTMPTGQIYGGRSLERAMELAARAVRGRIVWDDKRSGQRLISGLLKAG